MLFATIATIAFWVIWFFVDRALLANATTESYFAFQNAFPVADAWLAGTFLADDSPRWNSKSTAASEDHGNSG